MIFVSVIQFADSDSSASGIGAFNINLKSFIFQLITFVIVLLVFRRWILPPILKTLEDRRKTLEQSLVQAKETEEALARAEVRAKDILTQSRTQADEALAEAKKTASVVVTKAEEAAVQRTAIIIKEAERHLEQERAKLRQELRAELIVLVAQATEKIIDETNNIADDTSGSLKKCRQHSWKEQNRKREDNGNHASRVHVQGQIGGYSPIHLLTSHSFCVRYRDISSRVGNQHHTGYNSDRNNKKQNQFNNFRWISLHLKIKPPYIIGKISNNPSKNQKRDAVSDSFFRNQLPYPHEQQSSRGNGDKRRKIGKRRKMTQHLLSGKKS